MSPMPTSQSLICRRPSACGSSFDGTYRARLVESHGGALLGWIPAAPPAPGLAGAPYQHQPGPPVPEVPPPPPAAPVVNDDLLVELFHRVAALYLSERLPSSTEGELRNAIALYSELVAAHGPAGPPADAIAARIKRFRDWLRAHRDAILGGPRSG